MASNQSVQVTLGFQADTSNARKAIQDLNNQLNKLQSLGAENLHISGDIQEAANAAKILQKNLQSAMNFNTGQLNISQLAQNLQKAGTSVSELGQKLINAGTTGTQAFVSLGRAIAAMDVPLKQTNSALNNMMTTLKNTAKWELSSNLVHGLESAFSNAISYAKNLNSALNDIRIVSGASVEQMAKFAVEANTAAKALGTTTRAYADAALIYYQQGDSAEMAAKKAEITLKATNAAFSANAQEMSEMLTATWNSYQAGADELEHMVDVMANLGAHTATSMEEIATSLQKVAATANTVGVSMEQMSAMISTVSSVTRQSAQTIGTSMNTILSRIGGLKLGQTLEDGVDLNKYSKALASVGVQVLDAQGQLRNMGAVIDEIGEKWNQLSTAQQSALAQTVGGTRQYTSLMALFSNWDKYQENFELTQNSDGALQKMQDTYLQSWEGASQQLKTSLESVYQTLIDDEGMIKFTQSITSAVEQVQNLIQSFGGLPGILTQVGAIALQVFSKNIAQGLSSSITSVKTFVNSFKGLSLIEGQTGWQGHKLEYASKAVGMSTNGRIYNQQATQAYELLSNEKGANKDITLQQQIDASQILIEKKTQLQQIESSLTATEKAAAQAQLASLTAQASNLESLGQGYKEVSSELEKQERSLKSINGMQEVGKNSGLAGHTPGETSEKLNKEALEYMKVFKDDLNGELFDIDLTKIEEAGNGFESLIDHYEKLIRVNTNLTTMSEAFGNALTNSIETPQERLPKLITDLDTMKSNLEKNGVTKTSWITDLQKDLQTAADSGKMDNIVEAMERARTKIDEMSGSVSGGADIAFQILSQSLGISEDKLKKLAEAADLSEVQLMKMAQAAKQLSDDANGLQLGIGKIQSAVDNVTKAIGAMAGGFSSAFNLLANWDGANTASRITGIASTLTQAVNSLFSTAQLGGSIGLAIGGPMGGAIGAGVGAVASLITTGAGFVAGYNEQQEKARTKRLEEANKSNSSRNSQIQDELKTSKELIKTYNDLFERYQSGEDVQDELAASAQNLASAYGITGAAVAALTGNYEQFNNQIRESLSFTSQLNEAQSNFEASKRVAKDLKIELPDEVYKPYGDFTAAANSEAEQEDVLFNSLEDLLSDSSLKTDTNIWKIIGDAFTNYFNSEDFKAVLNNSATDAQLEKYDALSTGWKLIGDIAKRVNAIAPADASMLDTTSKSWNDLSFFGSQVLTGHRVGSDLGESLHSMFQSSTATNTDTFKSIFQGLFGVDYGGYFNQLVQSFEHFDLSLLSEYKNVNKIAEQVDTAAWDLDAIFNGSEDIYDQEKDVFLFDKTDMESISTTYHKYEEWRKKLKEYRSTLVGESEQTKYIDSLIAGIDQILGQTNLSEAVSNYDNAESYIAQLKQTQKIIAETIGENEKTTTFSKYLEFEQSLAKAIEEDPSLDSTGELQKLIEANQEDSEEYKKAVNRVKRQMITDLTAFDDFLVMSEALSESFTGDQYKQIVDFIDKNKIKSINQEFIHTLMAIFTDNTNAVLESYADILNNSLKNPTTETPALDKYNKYVGAQGSVKKNLTLEDSQILYDTYFANLPNADEEWGKFGAANQTERQKMIDNYVAAAQQAALQEARGQITSSQKKANDVASSFQQIYDLDVSSEEAKNAIQYLEEFKQYLDLVAEAGETPGKYKMRDGAGLNEAQQQWLQDGNMNMLFNDWAESKGYAKNNYNFIGDNDNGSMFSSYENFESFYNLYQDWLNATKQVDSAENFVKYMQLIGESADDAATNIDKLSSAFKSLPTSSTDMESLLSLINKHRSISPGRKDRNEEVSRSYSAQDLLNMSDSELEQLMIDTAKQELLGITSENEKALKQKEIDSMEKQHKDNDRDRNLADEKQILSELQAEYQKLSSIDITKMPKAGTSAYQALEKALKAVNIQMRDFNKMSDVDKVGALYKARQASLEQQRETALQIANAYNPKNEFSEGMDLSNKDADFVKRYQEWWNLYKEVINLDDQIKDSSTDEATAKMAVLTKEAEAIDKRMKDAQTEANKLQTEAQTFTNAIQTGELSASQRVGLSDKDIAKWDSLTSAEQRAAFAATKWSEAVIAGQQAFEESQALINNGITLMQEQSNRTDWKILNSRSLMSKDFINKYQDNPMIAQAYNQAINKGTIVEGTTTIKDGVAALKTELESMGEEGKLAWEKIEAAGIDAMNNVYKIAVQNEQTAAQEAIKAWQNAYTTIAEIRKSLFNKEDIGSVFFDPEKTRALAKSLGVTPMEAYEMYLNGSIDPKKMEQIPFNLSAAIQDRALNIFGLNSHYGKNFNSFRENYYKQNRTSEKESIDDFYNVNRDALLEYGKHYFEGFDEEFGLKAGSWQDYFDAILGGTVTEEMQSNLQKWNQTIASEIQVQERAYTLQDKIAAKEEERDALITEQTKVQQEAETQSTEYSNLASLASSILGGKGENLAASYLKDGQDANKVLKELNEVLGTQYKDIEDVSLQDWGEAADQWSSLSATETQKAADASAAIVGFWDQFIADLTNLGAPAGEIEKAQEARDAAAETAEKAQEKANATTQQSIQDSLKQWSGYAGINEKELVELADAFENLDKNTKILNEDTETYRKLLYETAAIAKRAEDGAKAIGEHYKKNKKEIEELSKATGEWTDAQKETVNKMKDNLSKAFNVEKKYLDDKFIKEHIDDYKELAKGSEEAAKKIQKALKDSILGDTKNKKIELNPEFDIDGIQDGISTVGDIIDSFADKYANEPIGFNIDTGPAIAALNQLLTSGAMTADQLKAALNSIGWNPQITYDWYDLEGDNKMTGKDTYEIVDKTTGDKRTVTATHHGVIKHGNSIGVPRIGEGGVTKINSATHAAKHAGSGGSGGGGGGGGGGSKPKHKEYKGDEEIERYHQINRQIEYQERLLKRVNLLKQQRYGLGYLRALEQENAELMKHIELVQRRAGPTQAGYWLENAKQIMAQFGVTYDGTRQINYRPYMFNLLDFYNSGVDEYNAMVDAGVPQEEAEEIFQEKYQKPYDRAKEAIQKYEEAMDYQLDAIEMTMEDLNKISANLKEMAVYKMQFKIELDEHDIKRLDFIIKRYDDYLDKQDESADLLMKNMDLVMKDLDYTGEAFDDLFNWYHIKVKVFDENAKWFQSMTSMEEDLKKQTQSFLNDADYVGGLQEVADKIMENLEKLEEYRKQMLEVYGHTIELAADKLENFTNTLEHHIAMYDGYLEILELISDGNNHYLEDIQLLNGAYNSSLTEIAVIREHLNVLLDQRQKLLTQMENPIYASNEKIQKDFEALEARIEELEQQLLDTTKTTLDKAKAMFDKALEYAIDKMSRLGDVSGTNIDWLTTQYDFWQKEQDQYVDRITQVYEVDKLVRDIEKSIADTRNKNNQAQLKALEDEIQLRSKNNALNEYSIEMMRLSYELLLARQNLENANESKDTVRLTRDDNGNYIYQYTADEDKIAEAQQKYNDVLYEMNQTTKERYRELIQSGLDYQKEFIDKYREIMEDMTLSDEEKTKRVEELYEHYANLLEGIDIFMDEVLQNIGENQYAWTQNMNQNLMDTAGTAKEQLSNIAGATREQLWQMYDNSRQDADTWKKGTMESINLVDKAWTNYRDKMLEVQKTSDITLQTMIKQITEYGKQAATVNDQASALAKTMQDVLDKLVKMNEQWISMDQKLQKVIDQYLALHKIIGEEEKKVANKDYPVEVEEVPLTPDEQEYFYKNGNLPTGGPVGTNAQGQKTKKVYYVDDPNTSERRAFNTEEEAKAYAATLRSSGVVVDQNQNPIDQDAESGVSVDTVGGDPYGCTNCSTRCSEECYRSCDNGCVSKCDQNCKGGCLKTCKDTCEGSCVQDCKGWCKHNTAMQVDGQVHKLKTGGLNESTGLAWLDGTLTEPEYVLNAEQTHEMFGILNDHTIYRLIDTMTAATQAMLSAMGLHAGSISTQSLVNSTNAQATTYITAEFPNATDHNEIELALQNLVNNTAQSINRFMN